MKTFFKIPPEYRNGYKDPKRLKAIHEIGCVLSKALGKPQTSKTLAHHKIGLGIGKKASDRLTMALCDDFHNNYNPESIHVMPLKKWEKKYLSQDTLIFMTDKALEGLL